MPLKIIIHYTRNVILCARRKFKQPRLVGKLLNNIFFYYMDIDTSRVLIGS